MTSAEFLRITRYVYVRDAICVVAFLTIAIYLLEVFNVDLARSTIHSSSHSHSPESSGKGTAAKTSPENPEPVDQLHELSPIPDDTAAISLADTFVWNDAS